MYVALLVISIIGIIVFSALLIISITLYKKQRADTLDRIQRRNN